MRFALLEAKVAVMAVLSKFSFTRGTKTQEPLVLDGESQLAWAKGGLWVGVEGQFIKFTFEIRILD